MRGRFVDLTGQRFGGWLVLKRVANDKKMNARWLCRCDCGAEREVKACDLKSGQTTKCFKCRKTHGLRNDPLYAVWRNMIWRCTVSYLKHYHNYGGRGIKICEEWKDMTIFHNWAIAHGYKSNLQIDRIDNDKNYCPENCRFVDRKTQLRNKRNNVYITINGIKRLLIDWAEETGLPRSTLYARVRLKWPEKYMFAPLDSISRIGKYIL